MRTQIVWDDLLDVSNEDRGGAGDSLEDTGFLKKRLLWPERFGIGYSHIYSCDKNNLTLGITQCALKQNVKMQAENPFTTFWLCFILSGNYHVSYSSRGTWQDRRGESVAWYLPDSLLHGMFEAKVRQNIVEFSVSLPLLTQWYQEEPEQFPRSWHPFLEGRHPTFLERSIIPPLLWTPLKKLSYWRPRGELQTLYMESKIHECFALYLAFLLGQERRTPLRINLSASDRKRVQEAALLMGETLSDSLTLNELAQRVNLSESKLKRGFQQLFGMGVHSYLQMLRLEMARYLLEQQEMSIKQVLAHVGHIKHGHFSKVFRQHFGINPKDYVKSLL